MTWFGSWSSLEGLQTIDDGPVPTASTGAPNAGKQNHDSTSRASAIGEAPGSGSLAAGSDKSVNSDGTHQGATAIDTLIAGHTSTGGINAGLNGLTEAAARIGIHLDGTLPDSVTGYTSGFWHRAGLPDTTEEATSAGIASNAGTATASEFTVTSALGADPVFKTRLASAGDDVEEKGSGTISTNINDLELGFESSTRQTVGLRFTGIDIPQGAIITSAYIQFQANEVKTDAASLLIKGQDTDDASPFTSTSFNVS
ncbi:hypothetical protein CK224_26760, partial [Mesorhizobium sp. WSM3862]